jgi:hypothetical protein
MPATDDRADLIRQRAAQIDSLQRGFTTSRDERTIASLFLATTGADLSALKNAIDAGEDRHTLHQLLYHDISDLGIRTELLTHFRVHAAPAGEVKVLSDVDDTFYENWIDTRYPKKTVFPGVRALYRELDIGPASAGRIGDLVFLTARPYDRLGITDHLTHKMLHAHGLMPSTILAGDFEHLLSNHLMAVEKHRRLREFAPLYPEYGFVFLGDSGQGDAIAGGLMVDDGLAQAVFIHDVVNTPESERAAQRERRIYFHDTYVGAATYACELGLISLPGLGRVLTTAAAELAAIEFGSPGQKKTMQDLFARDRAVAEGLLATAGGLGGSGPQA